MNTPGCKRIIAKLWAAASPVGCWIHFFFFKKNATDCFSASRLPPDIKSFSPLLPAWQAAGRWLTVLTARFPLCLSTVCLWRWKTEHQDAGKFLLLLFLDGKYPAYKLVSSLGMQNEIFRSLPKCLPRSNLWRQRLKAIRLPIPFLLKRRFC